MVEGPPGPGGLSYGRARLSSSKILVDARRVAGDVVRLSCGVSITKRAKYVAAWHGECATVKDFGR